MDGGGPQRSHMQVTDESGLERPQRKDTAAFKTTSWQRHGELLGAQPSFHQECGYMWVLGPTLRASQVAGGRWNSGTCISTTCLSVADPGATLGEHRFDTATQLGCGQGEETAEGVLGKASLLIRRQPSRPLDCM